MQSTCLTTREWWRQWWTPHTRPRLELSTRPELFNTVWKMTRTSSMMRTGLFILMKKHCWQKPRWRESSTLSLLANILLVKASFIIITSKIFFKSSYQGSSPTLTILLSSTVTSSISRTDSAPWRTASEWLMTTGSCGVSSPTSTNQSSDGKVPMLSAMPGLRGRSPLTGVWRVPRPRTASLEWSLLIEDTPSTSSRERCTKSHLSQSSTLWSSGSAGSRDSTLSVPRNKFLLNQSFSSQCAWVGKYLSQNYFKLIRSHFSRLVDDSSVHI